MAAGVKVNRLAKSAPPAQLPATVLHLYGLTQSPGPSAELFRDLKGVDGAASVEPLACAGLICWISRVSEADFARVAHGEPRSCFEGRLQSHTGQGGVGRQGFCAADCTRAEENDSHREGIPASEVRVNAPSS